MKKNKKKSWHELKNDKCPKCKQTLMDDLFGIGTVGCACSFQIQGDVKNLLVERDN